MTANTRRRVLLGASAAALGGAIARGSHAAELVDNLPPNVPEWMKREGLPLQGQPYTLPSKFEKHVARMGRRLVF